MENITKIKCNCGQVVIQIVQKEMFTGRPIIDFHIITEYFQNKNIFPVAVMTPHRCKEWVGPVYLTNNYIR